MGYTAGFPVIASYIFRIFKQMTFPYWLNKVGVDSSKNWLYNRNIILCNWVSLILSGIAISLGLIVAFQFGWIYSAKLSILSGFIFLVPLLLNRRGYIDISRSWLSVSLILCSLIISVIDKFDNSIYLEEFQYFEFRLTMLAVSVIPLVLFSLRERSHWIPLMIFNGLCFSLFDPVHRLFGAGYYQTGFTGQNYYFINVIVGITFIVLAGLTYFLKDIFERFENKNERLIQTLYSANENLAKKNEEIARHEAEILQANEHIEQQRKLLARENKVLNRELVDKNDQLLKTNMELIQHNNELMQFSYTVSHNLRGPVASLIGLINLLDRANTKNERDIIFGHVNHAVQSLDSIIRDLGSIIDYRNAVTQFKQLVNFEEEVSKICYLLKGTIDDFDVVIETDFRGAPDILSVKAMIGSILYNLINNAIKYRSPERRPHVHVSSRSEGEFLILEVSDNGLGLDTKKFKDKLFGLYRRFHNHTEGKGIGLFLVKLQAEALNGRVEAVGLPDVGTTFSVYILMQHAAKEQVLLENDLVRIIHVPSLDTIISHWKRSVSADEFRPVLRNIVEIMKAFRVPNWVADVTHSKNDEAELNTVRKNFYDQLQSFGVRRMGIVISKGDPNDLVRRDQISSGYSIELEFFESQAEVIQWLKKCNKADLIAAGQESDEK